MESIVEVKPLDNYHIWVKFADNFSATININLLLIREYPLNCQTLIISNK
jgi:hypothetical protein